MLFSPLLVLLLIFNFPINAFYNGFSKRTAQSSQRRTDVEGEFGRIRVQSSVLKMSEERENIDEAEVFGGVYFVGDGRAESRIHNGKIADKQYLFEAMGSENNKEGKPARMELALMPFETPLFPGSREFLFIYEMRFRSLMYDVQDTLLVGRCFASDDDQLGSVGSLCKIVESKKLQDGKGFL